MDVIELRQYTTYPGQRDVLVDVFDRALVAPQEATGIRVLGQFRDLDDDARFVWFRGFADLAGRAPALAAFYGGPAWRRHRDVANATMVDSDDVLLLRPVQGSPAAWPTSASTGAVDVRPSGASLVGATIYKVREASSSPCVGLLTDLVEPVVSAAGATSVALLETEPGENTFPALPVRQGERVLVHVVRFPTLQVHDDVRRAVRGAPAWSDLRTHLESDPEDLRLSPTDRSLLR